MTDEEFWTACEQRILLVQHCERCRHFQYPPLPRCGRCQGSMTYTRSAGRGSVYSTSTVHRPQDARFAVPYTVAIIAMDEGWHMLSHLVDIDAGEGELIGRRTEVEFRPLGSRSSAPCFKLLSETDNVARQ
jgi:hypothetical protein